MNGGDIKKLFLESYTGTKESLEHSLQILKDAGYSQMASLQCLMSAMNLSLTDADFIIVNSKAWSSEKSANMRFRDEFGGLLGE